MRPAVAVIVPIYNEAPVLAEVLAALKRRFSWIICVDDGSSDDSAAIARAAGVVVLTHNSNQGQGAALMTGLDFALGRGARYFITFDADGQHRPEDAERLLDRLRTTGADVVLGSRRLGCAEGMPLTKKLALKLALQFTNWTTGVQLTDTHNGLRAFNRHFAAGLKLRCRGMAHASEIIYRLKEGGYSYLEAPVTICYSSYSRDKGQSLFNAFNILRELRQSRRTLADQAE